MKNKHFQFTLGAGAGVAFLIIAVLVAKSVIAISVEVPRIDALTPTTGPDTGNTSVTITGINFDYLQSVTFDGLPATITSSTPTVINLNTPAHPAGPVDVIVTAGSFSTTASFAFTYTTVTPPPPVADPCTKKNKIAICHLPPGNIENEHTLCLPEPAINAHLAHGDYLGVCTSDIGKDITGEESDGNELSKPPKDKK